MIDCHRSSPREVSMCFGFRARTAPLSAAALLPLCAILSFNTALAQNSAIQGSVTDPNGSIVIGAAVTITNLDTGVSQRAASNDAGLYAAPLLKAGRYRVECAFTGFAPQERPEVRLEVDQTARIDFQLS